jgi:hypothetical protein
MEWFITCVDKQFNRIYKSKHFIFFLEKQKGVN